MEESTKTVNLHKPHYTSEMPTYLLHRVCETLGDLAVQRRLDLVLGDVFQSRQNGILNLALDSLLHDTRCILGELVGDELEDSLLTSKVGLLVGTT